MSREVWRNLTFAEAVDINPKRALHAGAVVPYVEMAAVPTEGGTIEYLLQREVGGGGAKFQNGDTLFARITPCAENGKTAFVDCLRDGETGLGSTELIVFGPKRELTDPEYIYHLARSDLVRGPAISQMVGTTGRARVPNTVFDEISIPLPPLPEQRRIAEILSSVDEAIAATRAVIEQTRKVKQGVLERLLTKGIGHTRFKQTEIGEIPEDWEVVELDAITPPDRKITYGIVQAGPDYPQGVPYIRVSDMGEYQIDEGRVLRTSPEISGKYLRSELQRDDIVFALRGKIGHVLRTPQSLSGANLTQGTARIACGDRVLSEFLLWALRSTQSERQYKREIKGSTFQELTLGSLKNIRVPLPSLEEQKLLAHRIEDVEAGLRSSERSLLSLVEAKSALMSDLLTGRKRVTDALPMAAE